MNFANKLTMLRILMVPVLILCFYLPLSFNMWLATVVFILASITDALDGRYARKHNLCSDFGRFLDPIADKLLVCSAFIMLVEFKSFPAVLTFLFIGREFIISGFRLVAAKGGTVIAAGITGKIKTVFQCIAIPFWLLKDEWIFNFAPVMTTVFLICMWAVTAVALIASVYSCAEYLYKNRKVISFK
ncbi:MAG: CDP-diacylglycerol--glycerol-3-phosphate 3-phosphatidyltransferase [Clostridia bacterium]|nr:CDP-diacylglycerol--glycerol-3-phosphate 3-phosphatidyltransferase [Clostridia bacterium]